MTPVERVEGVAAVLLRDDIDTDQLFPARFLIAKDFGAALFGSERYLGASTEENPDFVLNREPGRRARILVAGRNFGCGSSREHAVWALRDFGIGAVVAESFNEIFRDNCLRNGIVPAAVADETLQALARRLGARADARVAVDVAQCSITVDGEAAGRFELPALARRMLLAGLDEIALALQQAPAISAFEQRDRGERPWLWRAASGYSAQP